MDRDDALRDRVEGLVAEILQLADHPTHANLIDLVEQALISRALRQCGDNQVHTAKMLGISRNTLRHRIKKYGLSQTPTADASPDADDA